MKEVLLQALNDEKKLVNSISKKVSQDGQQIIQGGHQYRQCY